MTYSSSLINIPTPLVLDTSVLINLYACKYGMSILRALPNDILASEIALSELEHQTSKINGEHQFVRDLVTDQIIRAVKLNDKGYEVFSELVMNRCSLGDGEAATIATAASFGYLPVIDDQKGRNLAQLHMPDSCPAWSLDLLCHPCVTATIGTNSSIEAIFHALSDGRMRIHEDHCDYVVNLIGVHKAIKCPSLPNFKKQRLHWDEQIPVDKIV